jgi:uncharacterized protein (DUF4415 family)
MTVRKSIDKNTALTGEQLEMLEKAEALPIVYDEDSPELSDEELAEFKRIADLKRENRNKQTVTLRLSPQTLSKARALGKGYTSVLSRIIDLAMDDKELIKKCL